jgi:hypothetical protein
MLQYNCSVQFGYFQTEFIKHLLRKQYKLIGDQLYEAEFYNEIPKHTTIEREIQATVVELLHEYGYINDGQEYNFDLDVQDITQSDDNEVSPKTKLKSNYFKKQLQVMGAFAANTKSALSEDDSDDNVSEMTNMVLSHRSFKKVDDPMDEHRLCLKRGYMEKIAAKHQMDQGEKINKKRAKLNKPVLEVGDIGVIKVEGNTRAATDHAWLPIMVTSTRLISPNNIMYKLCTQHGHLRGEFVRGDIYPHEHITPEMLKINPTIPNFNQDLTVPKASALYNMLGGATFCRCKTNCLISKRCSCIALGKLCVEKCHGKRKDGKPIKCENCAQTN